MMLALSKRRKFEASCASMIPVALLVKMPPPAPRRFRKPPAVARKIPVLPPPTNRAIRRRKRTLLLEIPPACRDFKDCLHRLGRRIDHPCLEGFLMVSGY